MTRCDWIVCERANRWAPAVRTALPQPDSEHLSVVEVRSLADLSDRIEGATNSVVFIEVTPTNLDAVFSWLATKSRGSGCAVVAALNHELKTPAVSAALREAGANDVADSPRRLQSAIRLGISHTVATHRSKPSKPVIGQLFEAWAHSLLPWQGSH